MLVILLMFVIHEKKFHDKKIDSFNEEIIMMVNEFAVASLEAVELYKEQHQ